MFSEEILEKIRNKEEVLRVPLVFQCAMIHAIQEVLDEETNINNHRIISSTIPATTHIPTILGRICKECRNRNNFKTFHNLFKLESTAKLYLI